MNPKKILITGARGFIGSHLGNMLVEKGFEVVGVDDNSHPSANKVNFNVITGKAGEVDVQGFDVIVHLAAHINVDESLREPALYYENNVLETVRMLEHIKEQNPTARFVYASSAEVYGPALYAPMDLNHPLNPTSPYAETKKVSEDICLYYKRNWKIDARIVRNFNAFGHFQRGEKYGGVIANFKARAAVGKDLSVYGSGEQARDYSHVDQLVQGYYLTITKNDFPEIIHFGSGVPIRIIDIADRIARKFNVSILHTEDRVGEIYKSHADISEAKKYGYKIDASFWEKLEEYLDAPNC